jgi:hypothetical protein
MIAVKGRYFQKPEDYDEFALVAAGKYFLRLVDPRQEGENPELKPITSILNYIKKTLYPASVDWRKDNFSQILNPEANKYIDPEVISNNMKANIQSAYRAPSMVYIEEDVQALPQRIHKLVYGCQFRAEPLLCHRLYMSCLLSLLNSITLTNKSLEALHSYHERKGVYPSEAYINRLYSRASEDPIILWHLSEDYRDFVIYLVNRGRKEFTDAISETVSSFQLSDEVLDAILKSSYDTTGSADIVMEED